MHVVDRGRGVPIVMIPGIQGRWEWMAPAVEALATRCRVVTFSLCDEPTSGFPAPTGSVDDYLAQVEAVFDRAGLDAAVVMGISYAGPIATEFAVRHPHRVRGLVLVAALPPDWQPNARARFYLRAPRLLAPVFLVDAGLRAQREIRRALPRLADRVRFSLAQLGRVLRAFPSPARMAGRLVVLGRFRFSDVSGLPAPAVIITGEPGLDRVVPPEVSRHYLDLLPHARHAVIPRTGHLGLVTRPDDFAGLVHRFVDEIAHAQRADA